MMDQREVKRCGTCRKVKPVEQFYRHSNKAGVYYRGDCKACVQEKAKKRKAIPERRETIRSNQNRLYHKNRAERLAYQKAYYQEHRERILAYQKAYHERKKASTEE